MKHIFIVLAAVATVSASAAGAAPISAFSNLDMVHRYTVNSGSVPTGINLGNLPGSLTIAGGADSFVDDPAATNTETSSAVVGNPFTNPVIPFSADRTDITSFSPGFEGAGSQYNIRVTAEDDPDANPALTSITRRAVETIGAAAAVMPSVAAEATASAFYRSERGYYFENTTDALISFNIIGEVAASFSSSYDGIDGLARATGRLYNRFENGVGATISYLPLSPYLTTTEDADPGATVVQNLIANDSGFDFSASTTAIGSGPLTEASFDADFRYRFGVSLAPGGRVELVTGFAQANAVEYVPTLTAVPLPASVLFLLSAVGVASGVGRKKNA